MISRIRQLVGGGQGDLDLLRRLRRCQGDSRERVGLFSGKRAVVLTVWESFVDLFTRTPGSLSFGGSVPTDEVQLDRVSREHAEHEAQEGATLPACAGSMQQQRYGRDRAQSRTRS